VSIVRIGLGETKGFNEGYDAIFGVGKKGVKSTAKKKPAPEKTPAKTPAKATAKKPTTKKKK
jgi:hypothetical protein